MPRALDQARLVLLARVARVDDDPASWGTPEQIECFNAFTEAVLAVLDPMEVLRFETYALKANNDEIVEEGLRLALPHFKSQGGPVVTPCTFYFLCFVMLGAHLGLLFV